DAHRKIERSRRHDARATPREAFGEDQPRRIQQIDVDLAGLAFEKRQHVDDVHAGELAVEQLLDREPLAAIVHRKNDLFGVVLARERADIPRRVVDPVVLNDLCLVRNGQERNDLEAALIAATSQLQQLGGTTAGAVNDDPPPESVLIDDAREADAGRPEQQQRYYEAQQ